MNPQSVYHAYAMTYFELGHARSERKPVPSSVLARLARSDGVLARAVMRALRDVERVHPLRTKEQLLAMIQRGDAVRVA
jgi:hypothetical protein